MREGTYKRQRIIWVVLMIFVIWCAAGLCDPEISYGASMETIPDTSLQVPSESSLRMCDDNYKAVWTGVKGKTVTNSEGVPILCVPVKTTTKGFTYEDFLDITFQDVGSVGGRQMDAKIHFNSMKVSERKGSATGELSDGYMGVCYTKGGSLWLSCTINNGAGYRAAKEIDVTTTVYWHDTGETVELPFFQKISDIDTVSSYASEGWEAKEGFSGVYYKYSTCMLKFDGNKVQAPSSMETSGEASLLQCGFYAPISTGRFRSVFYEGNCSTALSLYSAHSNLEDPVKTSDGADRNFEGDDITYEVTQKIGKFYVDTMSAYDSFIMSDTLPEEVIYQGAEVYDENGDEITSKGSLEYDEDTRTVVFSMGKEWLSDKSNYTGQKITLRIDTKVGAFAGPVGAAVNEGVTKIDNAELCSNQVEDVLAVPYHVKYEYVSGTEGRDLPDKISVEEGDYKIKDESVYYEGDKVIRCEEPADGAKFQITDDRGRHEGYWVLSWDAEEKTVEGGDVTFTGTWDYVPAPKLIIVKKLPDDEDVFTKAHGDAAFLFKAVGDETGRAWYRSVTFTDEAVEAVRDKGHHEADDGTEFILKNGFIYGICEPIYLPEDDYTVSEADTLRFASKGAAAFYYGDELSRIDSSGAEAAIPLKVSEYRPGDQGYGVSCAIGVFENEKERWDKLSHTDIIINQFTGDKGGNAE